MTDVRSFIKPTVTKKILSGYLALAVLVLVISLYSLANLDKLNRIISSIVREDMRTVRISEEMIDNLFEQEQYARRSIILESPEMLRLFGEKSERFREMAGDLRSHSPSHAEQTDRILSLHAEYEDLVTGRPLPADPVNRDSEMQLMHDRLVAMVKHIYSKARVSQQEKILLAERIGSAAMSVAAALSVVGIVLGIAASVMITRNISRSIAHLKRETERISSGRFDLSSPIGRNDEFGDLSVAFIEMARRLKNFEEMNLDASPLTYLPGGVAIERELRRRVAEGSPSVFCYADLDNFKAYNDHYSYAKGSEVIKATARMIGEVVTSMGSASDFVGHIGGDDFVFITETERYQRICTEIVERFDRTIASFYSPEDVRRGYITGRNRQKQEIRFPLMTISIAVVTNESGKIKDSIQISEIAAELKEYAKSIPGSLFVTDRRYEKDQSDRVRSESYSDRAAPGGSEC